MQPDELLTSFYKSLVPAMKINPALVEDIAVGNCNWFVFPPILLPGRCADCDGISVPTRSTPYEPLLSSPVSPTRPRPKLSTDSARLDSWPSPLSLTRSETERLSASSLLSEVSNELTE